MKVDLSVIDFLDRAELVFPDRIAIVDEPDQPAESWGALTAREFARRARNQAAHLDALGIGVGERVAICLLYTSPSPRDRTRSRMPSSA